MVGKAAAFAAFASSVVGKIVIQLVVSAIASKIFGKKKGRGAGPRGPSEILVNKQGNNEPIPVVYGRQRTGGTRAIVATTNGSGDHSANNILNMCIILAEGEVGTVQKVYFGDTVLWDASGSGTTNSLASGGFELQNYAETKYGSHYIAFYPGTTTQTVDTTIKTSIGTTDSDPKNTWDDTRKLTGLCYIALKLPFDEDYNGAVPEVTVEFAGKKIADVSSLSTGDTSVSTYTTTEDQNPADVLYDYLTNKIYGKALDHDTSGNFSAGLHIDLASFQSARTYWDNSGSPKFAINGFLDTGNKIYDNIEEILASCNGILIYDKGKYYLKAQKQNESSTFTFDTSNIVGSIDVQRTAKNQRFNKVEMVFNNSVTKFNDDIVIVDNATYLADDNGTVLLGKQDLTLVSDETIATNLATWLMDSSRDQMGISFKTAHTAIDVQAGDIVAVTHEVFGFTNKLFRVQEISLAEDDLITITAVEYISSIQI
jgi:hypothetical protein